MPLLLAKTLTDRDLALFAAATRPPLSRDDIAIDLGPGSVVQRMHPGLAGRTKPLLVCVDVSGPGGAPAFSVTRRLARGRGLRWCLGGERIYDPDEEPGRFGVLRAGDMALVTLPHPSVPEDDATLCLLAWHHAGDRALIEGLRRCLPEGELAGVVTWGEVVATASAVPAKVAV